MAATTACKPSHTIYKISKSYKSSFFFSSFLSANLDDMSLKMEHIQLGGITLRALHTPCHTTSHFSFYVEEKAKAQRAVFTGDCLFIAGCGRFFEGVAKDMYSSFIERLGALPDDTHVYCGHEYTKANLAFAKAVEPTNSAIKVSYFSLFHFVSRLLDGQGLTDTSKQTQLAKMQTVTVPSTIQREKEINPFMRVAEPAVQQYCGTIGDPIATMAALRERKNGFKG